MIHRISWCYILAFLAFLGCDSPPPHHPQLEKAFPISIGSQFDPSLGSTICGRVIWEEDIPVIPSFEVWSIQLSLDGTREKRLEPNPNAPAVDAKTRGIANAVVFLREVDLLKSKPWDHLPVRVEMRDRQFHILQGDTDSRIGFVRRGDSVEMVSRESVFHSLHAAGASFFTLPFPDPDDPDSRHLNARGIVELTSAAGYYAMRAYLFVDDHPYYTKTDAEGRFVLEQVPPGEYEVVGWMPNWNKESHERDPETAIISRLFFHPPAKQTQSILLRPKETRELNFQFSARSFLRKP
jgi:hypothetical protein